MRTPDDYLYQDDQPYYSKGRKKLFVRIARVMNYICFALMVTNAVLRFVYSS